MKYSVYLLKCPIHKTVKYVGITKNLKDRFRRHVQNKEKNEGKKEWIKWLKSFGLIPELEVEFYDVPRFVAEKAEEDLIKEYPNLFNIDKGGLNPPSRLGVKMTDSEKKQRVLTSSLRKEVIQMNKNNETMNVFIGVREASRITGIDHRSIAQVAAGSLIRKTAGGFKWKYK